MQLQHSRITETKVRSSQEGFEMLETTLWLLWGKKNCRASGKVSRVFLEIAVCQLSNRFCHVRCWPPQVLQNSLCFNYHIIIVTKSQNNTGIRVNKGVLELIWRKVLMTGVVHCFWLAPHCQHVSLKELLPEILIWTTAPTDVILVIMHPKTCMLHALYLGVGVYGCSSLCGYVMDYWPAQGEPHPKTIGNGHLRPCTG